MKLHLMLARRLKCLPTKFNGDMRLNYRTCESLWIEAISLCVTVTRDRKRALAMAASLRRVGRDHLHADDRRVVDGGRRVVEHRDEFVSALVAEPLLPAGVDVQQHPR